MVAYVSSSGVELPERVVSNSELAELLSLDADHILRSSGIRERRWAEPGLTTGQLAGAALKKAMDHLRLGPGEIDYLLLGTMTPDRFVPGTAPTVQKNLGLGEIPCLDIRAACCNTLYGLQLARALLHAGVARNIAICLAEIQSPLLDLSSQSATTSMLFGDGAAALIVTTERAPSSLAIIDVFLATDGTYVDDLGIRFPGNEFRQTLDHRDHLPRMVGQSVILQASRKMTVSCRTILERNSLEVEDVRWLVPHQANANLIAQVARGLQLSEATEVVSVIEKTGNTSSASMGIALDQLLRSGSVREGDYVLLPAFAAGFTWGAALCRAV